MRGMPSYTIVVEQGAENCSAYAPDLPGCIATGQDVEETIRLMREAVAFHVEGLRLEGLPVPAPKTVCAQADVD